MCGIAGFINRTESREEQQQILSSMVAAVSHRGPDGRGFHVAPDVALGHARLSVIDLSYGSQPMCNEDASIWITLNGEVFNYLELRKRLEAAGHVFRTRSDTETVLHAYEEDGVQCVDALNGDFAFALWDSRRRQLMLARDRLGVRPLYYTMRGDSLAFASEVKALLQLPDVNAELDPLALDQAFTFWFPLAPRTPFRGINELPPGHVLVAVDGAITTKQYWRLQFLPQSHDARPSRRCEEACTAELRDLLLDATRIRLRADVEVGAYLSGGLDSTVTTALIRLTGTNRLRTFSVAFESDEYDETRFQREAADALQTDHYAILCTARSIGEAFPKVMYHAERPILRTAPAPLLALSALVRNAGVKVVMTGEGADELFAGYDIFKEDAVRRLWAHHPSSRRLPLLLRRLYPYMPAIQSQPQLYLEAFFRPSTAPDADPFFSHRPRWATTSAIKLFFSDDLRDALAGYDAVEELAATLPPEFASWHPLSRAQYLEAAYLLPSYILSSQGDRMAMANAVEARFPFLDHRVADLAARIPPALRLRGLTEKHILRKSMGHLLPTNIANRPKQPYRAPDAACFLGPEMPGYVHDLLSPAAIEDVGCFDPSSVAKLVRKCAGRPTVSCRDGMAIVGILSVQLLHHLFVRRGAASSVSSPMAGVA